jgi:hypothetical protein
MEKKEISDINVADPTSGTISILALGVSITSRNHAIETQVAAPWIFA